MIRWIRGSRRTRSECAPASATATAPASGSTGCWARRSRTCTSTRTCASMRWSRPARSYRLEVATTTSGAGPVAESSVRTSHGATIRTPTSDFTSAPSCSPGRVTRSTRSPSTSSTATSTVGMSASAAASSDSAAATVPRRGAGRWIPKLTAVLLSLAVAARARAGETEIGAAAPDDAATGAIRVYQRYLSDLRHARCRFTPSCSEYAAQAIARYGLVDGSARAADRLMRCNASASGAYPRGENGTLRDPVGDDTPPAGVVWAPGWLRLAPEPESPPVADTVGLLRRARLDETVAFALRLEKRGERAGAAVEFQRAGMLAGLSEADAWAFRSA